MTEVEFGVLLYCLLGYPPPPLLFLGEHTLHLGAESLWSQMTLRGTKTKQTDNENMDEFIFIFPY